MHRGVGSSGGPRFRIVPGPVVSETARSSTLQRHTNTLTSSSSMPTLASSQGTSVGPLGTAQQMTVASQRMRHSPGVQYVVVSQGTSGPASAVAHGGAVNGGALASQVNGGSAPQAAAPPAAASTHPQAASAATANGAEQANLVTKCVRFFKTLIHLSQQPEQQQGQQTASRVAELVRLVIFGSMPPETFTEQLQEALRSQAQPHLLPFLQKTLPSLRVALQKGDVVIEGIDAPGSNIQHQHQQQQQQQQPPTEIRWAQSQPPPNKENLYVVQTQPTAIYGAAAQKATVVGGSLAGLPRSVESRVVEAISDDDDVRSMDQAFGETDLRSLPAGELLHRMLNGHVIARKIQRAMPDGGTANEEVISMISQAVEYRLRYILTHLSAIAEHRLEQFRTNPLYQSINDTRRELRFVEELERREYEKQEMKEKEVILRFSKGKAKDAVFEKVKQQHRADLENRDANAAAMAALGGSRGVKRSWSETNTVAPLDQACQSGLSTSVNRPRTKRVTMRDLQFVMDKDPLTKWSPLRLRLCLFNSAGELPNF